jgi:undecaprenyl-diphosphatase
MPPILQAILLGIVQGLTELLPISSSAHLLILPQLLGWQSLGLPFDVALHTGTTLAIIVYFARDYWGIGSAYLTKQPGPEELRQRTLGGLILLSCLPAGFFGILFKHPIETVFRSPLIAGINLIVFGVVLFLIDRFARNERPLTTIGWRDALFIGLLQTCALVPGVSRSGITITAGRLRALQRSDAARFSFLMIAPLVAGATGLEFFELYRHLARTGRLETFFHQEAYWFLAGMLAAFLSGLAVIRYFLRFLQRFPLDAFVIYRILFGGLVIVWWWYHY